MRKDLPPIEPYERTAHYYETDRMGIIHHSNYIRWFEETKQATPIPKWKRTEL